MLSYALSTVVLSATSTLVDQGTRVDTIVKTYPAQIKTVSTVDQKTLAALKTNPNDPAAVTKALSELSGQPMATVGKVLTASATLKVGGKVSAAREAVLKGRRPGSQRCWGTPEGGQLGPRCRPRLSR
jgi:hypothetical protein